MRLFELINFEPKDSKRSSADYRSRIRNMPSAEVAGYGNYGTAYNINSGKRLNQVTKVGRAGSLGDRRTKYEKAVNKDGYLSYLSEIYKGKHKNPYFPRIHDLKIFRDNIDNTLYYRVNMEKLIRYDSEKIRGNYELMFSLCDRMFFLSSEDVARLKNPYEFDFFIRESLVDGLKNQALIKDKNLKEALIVIKNIISNNSSLDEDLHDGNLMWRITGTMPQLVLLDPIS